MLYQIEHDIVRKYQYAYKDQSFIGYTRSVCSQCSRQIAIPQFDEGAPHLLLEGGLVFPDYLQFCGAGKQLFLVSEKALSLFEKNGITGYTGYQLVTSEAINKGRNNYQIPDYYSLNITGRIDFDFAAMHLKKKRICPQCGQFDWNRFRIEPIIVDHTTWDGYDLCLLNSIRGIRICSENLKKLVQEHLLTGFSFRPSF